ncbi:MAG: hypothetical protein GX767_08925 [Firmicutes bacterium]|jgi:hypothetical protein|nr:hypothetical protein [Bacillota bacterium]
MQCPVCNRLDAGKVGTNQYFCPHCFVEFNMTAQGVKLYYIESDGSLVALDDMTKPYSYIKEDSGIS